MIKKNRKKKRKGKNSKGGINHVGGNPDSEAQKQLVKNNRNSLRFNMGRKIGKSKNRKMKVENRKT